MNTEKRENDEMSIYDICNRAYMIQDACNLYPVLGEIQRMIKALSYHGLGTDEIYSHPAIILMVDKINHLTHMQNYDGKGLNMVMDAYRDVREAIER